MFAKKMTIVGLACLLAVEASGCGNTGGGQVTSIRIGVSVYDQYDTFVSEMINHFNEYASEVSASSLYQAHRQPFLSYPLHTRNYLKKNGIWELIL